MKTSLYRYFRLGKRVGVGSSRLLPGGRCRVVDLLEGNEVTHLEEHAAQRGTVGAHDDLVELAQAERAHCGLLVDAIPDGALLISNSQATHCALSWPSTLRRAR